ncbi:MAG: DUF4442 domain-containing protein [Bacteroidetes bacterium]|jgi:hypothetical protein|nr:DUF4442 domain-containing protein [Bacteroidota bacterium]
MTLQQLINKAGSSGIYLRLLNIMLWQKIPFNAPHRFKITKISPGKIEIKIPFRRSNLNHINSIHACALATASEYASGFCLTTLLPEKEYRLILKSLNTEYFFQGKKDIFIQHEMDKNSFNEILAGIPEETGAALLHMEVEAFDTDKNHISTSRVEWQIKKWSHVKTKV